MFSTFCIVLRTLFSSAHFFYGQYVLICTFHFFIIISSCLCLISSALFFSPFYRLYVLGCASHFFYMCTSFISSSSETIIILVPLPALFCNLISLISITDFSLPLETSVIFVSSEDKITVLSSLFL